MAGIKIDASKLLANLENAETKSQVAIRMFAQEGAKKFENHAKKNRPWTDRTGQARQRLTGYVEAIPVGFRINIAHGVDYGIWLEYAHEMKYAILEPTVRIKGQEVINGMNNLLEKVGIIWVVK